MPFAAPLDVVRGTFFFFTLLQFSWTAWTFNCLFPIFMKSEIPMESVGLLCVSAALNCVGYIVKVIAFLSLSIIFGQLCVFFLILKVLFDVAFWFITALSVDLFFGLHFYYDLTLLTAVMGALDMVIFPYFLISEHEKVQRKQK